MGCTVVQTEHDTVVTGPPPGTPLQALGTIDMGRMTDAFLTAAVLAGECCTARDGGGHGVCMCMCSAPSSPPPPIHPTHTLNPSASVLVGSHSRTGWPVARGLRRVSPCLAPTSLFGLHWGPWLIEGPG
jgi:hypothetical protein